MTKSTQNKKIYITDMPVAGCSALIIHQRALYMIKYNRALKKVLIILILSQKSSVKFDRNGI